jgi:DNA invertase Pin-like site-specific DNA recombinase
MTLIGYARVSTDEQNTAAQTDVLRAAGCGEIFEERASGGDAARPALARAVARAGPGDTLVVARIDRLARSLAHLLSVIAALRAKGADFRSLGDPIDTTSPQGVFTLQVLGAAAEFERALIRERTKAGLRAAKARGRVGGNPGLRRGEPGARRKLAAARRAAALAALIASAEQWLPVVRRMRPARPWAAVARAVGDGWTAARLTRAVRRFVAEGLAEAELLAPAPRRPAPDRLVAIVAGMARARPGLSLRAMAEELAAMREAPPRGGAHWPVSSVAHLLARARAAGLLHDVTSS